MVLFFPSHGPGKNKKTLLPAATSYAVNITIYGLPREDFVQSKS